MESHHVGLIWAKWLCGWMHVLTFWKYTCLDSRNKSAAWEM